MNKLPHRGSEASSLGQSQQGRPPEQEVASQRTAGLWFLLGILLFVIGFVWLPNAFRTGALWLNKGDYVPAELEVQALYFDQAGGRGSSSANNMEGVITPGGESVRVDVARFNVMIFDGKYDATGRLPMLHEIKGKRLLVWYRRSEGGDAFWMPERVFSTNEFRDLPGLPAVLGHTGFCAVMFTLAFRCVRRCLRVQRGEVRPAPSLWPWYLWPGVAVLLVTSFLYWVLVEAMLEPRLNWNGTQRIERTPREKFIAGTGIVVFTVFPLGSLYVVVLALQQRFAVPRRLDETPQEPP